MQRTEAISTKSVFAQKLKQYSDLTKFKLSMTVAISAMLGYLYGADFTTISWGAFALFTVAGLMVTCASNILNEIIEKDTDKLMERTMGRPLPMGTMTVAEAMITAGIMGVLGAEAPMVPVELRLRSLGDKDQVVKEKNLKFNVFVQQKWTPFLMMLTMFNSISSDERSLSTTAWWIANL